MNILIFGKNGQLAKSIKEINRLYNHNIKFISSSDVNFTHDQLIQPNIFNGVDLVIICSAYTDVESSEEVSIRDELYKINCIAPYNLSLIARSQDIKVISFSTDYVFDGKNTEIYNEFDPQSPINEYGKSKFLMEKVLSNIGNVIIFRVSWLFSLYGNNFYTSILNKLQKNKHFTIVDDQKGGPTSATQLANFILDNADFIASDLKTGIYHFHGFPYVTWFEFGKKIALKNNLDESLISPIASKNFLSYKAKRPKNSKIKSIKLDINEYNSWEDSL